MCQLPEIQAQKGVSAEGEAGEALPGESRQ